MGDNFIRAFVPHLLYPGAKPLHSLDISMIGIRDKGILSLCTLLAYTNTLARLNIAGNSIIISKYKDLLNFALQVLYMYEYSQ